MKIECNDIVVFKTPDSVFKSRVSKVDGNVIKLFEEDGSYDKWPEGTLYKWWKRALPV